MRELRSEQVSQIRQAFAAGTRVAYMLPGSVVVKAPLSGFNAWPGYPDDETVRDLGKAKIPIIDLRRVHEPQRLFDALPPLGADGRDGPFCVGHGNTPAPVEVIGALTRRFGSTTYNIPAFRLHPGMFREPTEWEKVAYQALESGEIGKVLELGPANPTAGLWEPPEEVAPSIYGRWLEQVGEELRRHREGQLQAAKAGDRKDRLKHRQTAEFMLFLHNTVVFESWKHEAGNYRSGPFAELALASAATGLVRNLEAEYGKYLGMSEYSHLPIAINEVQHLVEGLQGPQAQPAEEPDTPTM